jgi:hypothetical protein
MITSVVKIGGGGIKGWCNVVHIRLLPPQATVAICMSYRYLHYRHEQTSETETQLDKTLSVHCTDDLDANYFSDNFDVHGSVHRNIFLQYNQQGAPVSQIIYSCKTLYMFRTVFPCIIRSSKLRIGQQAYVKQILLLPAASGDEMEFHWSSISSR